MAAPQTDPQYKLRFSEALRDRIAEAAKANNRSMNAEITARLEASFGAPPTDASTNFDAYAASLAKMTAAEIAARSLEAMITMMQSLEGKAADERTRIMTDAVTIAQRGALGKVAQSRREDPEGAN